MPESRSLNSHVQKQACKNLAPLLKGIYVLEQDDITQIHFKNFFAI